MRPGRGGVAAAILLVLLLLAGMTVTSLALAQDDTATEEATDDATTEAPSEEATTEEATTEAPTDEPTDDATTEAPTDAATEATTEAPTDEATEEVTATAEPPSGGTYVVQPGDNLYRIALRFGTTINAIANANGIVNVNSIFVGQRLTIPGSNGSVTATPAPGNPAPTPEPGETESYVVQPGDTLLRIAVRFGTTINQLIAANNIANPNLIFWGQTLQIPTGEVAAPEPDDDDDDGEEPAETIVPDITIADPGFDYGVQMALYPPGSNDSANQAFVNQAVQLGVDWVKHEVSWREIEATQGQIDFATLDAFIELYDAAGLEIMLTVTNAPDWSRESEEENGPPDDFAQYASFVGALASRYTGIVDAYEIWNEPNLRREWNSTVHSIGADSYADLLEGAYTAIKAADTDAIVVSAGLAPTGFNDGVNAISDRVFLDNLYDEDFRDFSDVVGAHPGGWANPPDSTFGEQPPGVETHFEDPTFFFLNNIQDYRRIMVENGDGLSPIWITKFGWGTSEDTDPPSPINIFITYTSLGEQAIYVPRAFELGQELGYIGPMFLYNLNGCVIQFDGPEGCFNSLIGPDGSPRPVFTAVQALDMGDEAAATPEPTTEEATEAVATEETVTPEPEAEASPAAESDTNMEEMGDAMEDTTSETSEMEAAEPAMVETEEAATE